jgi:hypothetical protein
MSTIRYARLTSVWARGQVGVPASTWYGDDTRPGIVQCSRREAAVAQAAGSSDRRQALLLPPLEGAFAVSTIALLEGPRHRRTASWTGPQRGLTTILGLPPGDVHTLFKVVRRLVVLARTGQSPPTGAGVTRREHQEPLSGRMLRVVKGGPRLARLSVRVAPADGGLPVADNARRDVRGIRNLAPSGLA